MATTNIADRLVCLTQAAFAELGEGFGLAEGALGMGISYAVISGEDSRLDGAPYVNQIFLGSTGGPGGPSADGWPTYYLPVAASLMYHDSTEVDEQKYPIHVHVKRLIPDSEGPGRHRGALGSEVVYGPKDLPMTIAYTFEGHENPARGVRGGGTGSPSDGWKYDREGNRVDIPMAAAMTIEPGERVLSRTGGGGGYGSPLTRDPEAVADDVREGWVSLERARSEYGVILSGDGVDPADLAVDDPATTIRARGATTVSDDSMQRAVRIETDPDPYEQFLIAQAYRVGNLMFVSGQAATDPGRGGRRRWLRRSSGSRVRQPPPGARGRRLVAGEDHQGQHLSDRHGELPQDHRAAPPLLHATVPRRHDRRGRRARAARADDRDRSRGARGGRGRLTFAPLAVGVALLNVPIEAFPAQRGTFVTSHVPNVPRWH